MFFQFQVFQEIFNLIFEKQFSRVNKAIPVHALDPAVVDPNERGNVKQAH